MNAFRKLAAAVAMVALVPLAVMPLAPAIAQPGWAGYQLGPEDQIEVQMYGQGGSTVKTRIKSDGTIALPLIGRIRASDQSTQALAASIEAALKRGGYINNPIVNVEVATYASRTVTMLGEFGNPGLYPLDRPLSLSEMVAKVGGLRGGATDTVVLRRATRVERYSLGAIARGEVPDVVLLPGDSVYAANPQYYIYGQVGNAGVFGIAPQMTIRQALARAGGPTLAGSERKITLYRDGKEQEADLSALIQPNDVLFVRERIF